MAARMLLICLLLLTSLSVCSLNAEQADQLIRQQAPELFGNSGQLVSVYYFGQSQSMSVVGLERVGDDYLPIRWLLIIKGDSILGWYYPSDEFPLRFVNGHLIFPKGASVEDVYLLPDPPSYLTIDQQQIPFHEIQRLE